jgi:hypothetical protein
MDLDYNTNSGLWTEPEGVQMRPIDFGGVQGIDYLDYQFGAPGIDPQTPSCIPAVLMLARSYTGHLLRRDGKEHD